MYLLFVIVSPNARLFLIASTFRNPLWEMFSLRLLLPLSRPLPVSLSPSAREANFLTPYLLNLYPSRANSWILRSCVASEGRDEPHQGQHQLREGQFLTPLASLGPHLLGFGP
ncbi:hypothetical protein AVEN_237977-1 [Araneus ventricosus]|uniref:Uncharacterized protein n=1 Tax=Araneus ventricosus TaxID=182803 RepID=A0A4Y2G759_ARAVE|nr:hypothetical protein AVEN_237977-1 [Araneus ventricosus]